MTTLKKLAGSVDSNKGPQTPKKEGLLTPRSSPVKRPLKREGDDADQITPRKLAKRTTSAAPKYKLEDEAGEEDALFENDDEDFQAGEWKPHTVAVEIVQKTEVDVGDEQMDYGFENHHFERSNHYLSFF